MGTRGHLAATVACAILPLAGLCAGPTTALGAARQQPFVTASVTTQPGSVRVTIVLRSEPDLRYSVRLNGHDVTSQLSSRLGLRRVTVLGADDGLRRGRNTLTVRAARGDGPAGRLSRTFFIASSAPLVAAGPDVQAIFGQRIALRGGVLAGGGHRSYRWRLVLAPRGSKARVEHAGRLRALLAPDKPGTYRLRLTARIGGRDATDEVTVLSSANYPPIGAPVDTMANGGSTIKIGTFAHTFNPGTCNAVNVVVMDRYTLAVPLAISYPGTPLTPFFLGARIGSLIQGGQLNEHPLVVVSDPKNNPNPACRSVTGPAWNVFLKTIGGKKLPSSVRGTGGWSIVGTETAPAGTAWQNDGSNQAGDPVGGRITGYLQNDYVGPFAFVPPERIPLDLKAPGAATGQNIMQVASTQYTSSPLPCGSGGFQVVTLNAVTLAKLSSATAATNGCGTATDSANQQALAQYLTGVAQNPGFQVSRALVLVQSIGNPYDSSATQSWSALDTAMAGVGGTETVLASDTGGYSLIGNVGIDSFPLVEGSDTAVPNSSAHATAVLKRGASWGYEPELGSNARQFGFSLATLAYQPSQTYAETAGERKALNWISTTVLGLPVPTTNTASTFCYIPPPGQLDVRYAYCDPALANAWNGSQFASDLNNAKWSPGLGFTQADLSHVISELLPAKGQGEFFDVSEAWTLINELKSAMNTSGTTALSIMSTQAATIRQALKGHLGNGIATGVWFDALANTLNLLGAIFVDDEAIAPEVNLLAAGLYLAEDGTYFAGSGSSALGRFSLHAANFEEALTNAYQSAGAGMNHLLGMIVTDPGKLKTFEQNSAEYTYNPTLSSDGAFQAGAAAFAWQTLLPSAYQLLWLQRDKNNNPNHAQDYVCEDTDGTPYRPFRNATESGQLLNSNLYVMVKNGATLPDGSNFAHPPRPPAALTDPLFESYAVNNGVITQFGLYKPWFYRRAYNPPTGATPLKCY